MDLQINVCVAKRDQYRELRDFEKELRKEEAFFPPSIQPYILDKRERVGSVIKAVMVVKSQATLLKSQRKTT